MAEQQMTAAQIIALKDQMIGELYTKCKMLEQMVSQLQADTKNKE